MSQRTNPAYPEIVRLTRAFLMMVLAADAVALRPNKPRVRGPLTPLADKLFRILVFHFENVLTGLCFPSIATLASTAGASQSQAKVLLKALACAEYLTWRHGKRKRVKTRKGWRVVRSANRYRILCPRRHLAALRRWLIKHCGGRHGPIIQAVMARFTPPSEEEKEAEQIVASLAADLRARPGRTAPPPEPETPARSPPAAEGPIEVGGIIITDPKLGSALEKLWAAMEKREQREP